MDHGAGGAEAKAKEKSALSVVALLALVVVLVASPSSSSSAVVAVVAAFETPRSIRRRPPLVGGRPPSARLRPPPPGATTANNNDDDDDGDEAVPVAYDVDRNGNVRAKDPNAAYSGMSNAWGYSRSVVNDRQRRRYERRRASHRFRLEKKRDYSQSEMGGGGGGESSSGGNGSNNNNNNDVDSVAFDDMNEDGYYGAMGGKKRGLIGGLVRRAIMVPYRALVGEYRSPTPGTLILVRHGESVWNANKTFTGWADPDLSPQGYREVEHAARLLVEGGYNVDIVFTSRLKRAIRSSWILLRELNEVHLPVFKSWRLNERMYGALTGLSKSETAERLGADLVQEWRGSLMSRPPALSPGDVHYPGRDRRHADLSPSQIPLTESLLDCMERTRPVWLDKISYEIACGRNVLVVAHANTLRGLVKIIDDVGDDEIQDIAIPTGIPIIYNFDGDLNPISPSVEQGTVSQVHMSGVFLEKPGA
jgi:2,3-bisphosphoglycerate-dependent phosphoglycerate mutase